jgi:hypothetical protein
VTVALDDVSGAACKAGAGSSFGGVRMGVSSSLSGCSISRLLAWTSGSLSTGAGAGDGTGTGSGSSCLAAGLGSSLVGGA